MSTFFRVLTPRFGNDPGTIQRWLEGRFTSTHVWVPGHWSQTWHETHSPDPEDYPLEWNGCTYTIAARGAFLRFAPTHERADIWPINELNQVGEYEGVSAFSDVQQALNYGGGAPGKRYVVFDGNRLFPLPEDAGYSVRVVRELVPPMDETAFRTWIAAGCRTQAG